MSRYRIKHVYPYYNGCIPIDVWIVQRYESGFLFGKWVNIKGFDTSERAQFREGKDAGVAQKNGI